MIRISRAGAVLFSLLVVAAVLPAGVAAADDVTLTVTVVDEDGDPISGVDLAATWDGGEATETTRSNGQALIDVPEGAEVTIETDHEDYVRNRPYVVEEASGQSVEIEMPDAGAATVRAENADGALDNAVVRLFQDDRLVANARTDGEGEFTTGQIEQDEYRLVVFKEGYRRNTTNLTVDGEISLTVRVEHGSVPVTFAVTEANGSQPIENATVSVDGVDDARTLGDGETTIRVPVNDGYDVTVTKTGYESATEEIRVRESESTVNVTLQESDETPTPTASATATETATDTATNGTDSPTATSDDGAGLGVVVALVAIVGLLGLLGVRRRS